MLSNKWVPQAKQPTEQGSTEGKKEYKQSRHKEERKWKKVRRTE